ncbi:MAG: VOC family protein [Saprospiraceae bacterium]|nr:VOC family protein [Saprospiraceae bacterium]
MEFRSARHTNDLGLITDFYTSIIGLDILFNFENHNGYSGVFLGKANHSWHLEFTSSKTQAHHVFDSEDLLVFYPLEKSEYDTIIERIEKYNIKKNRPNNPFWMDNGVYIKDPDGFGIIVSNFKLK